MLKKSKAYCAGNKIRSVITRMRSSLTKINILILEHKYGKIFK